MLNDETYNIKLDKYLQKYPDTSERDFLTAQIYSCRTLINSIESKSEYSIQEEAINKIGSGDYDKVMQQIELIKSNDIGRIGKLKKKVRWYQTRLARTSHLKSENFTNDPKKTNQIGLTWVGENIELAELLKSLCASKKFQGHTDKEVFEQFCKFLNIKDMNKTETLKTLRKRTDKKTRFIDNLSISFTSWIDAKDN